MKTNTLIPVLQDIAPGAFRLRPHKAFDNQWFLLTAGDVQTRRFNAMTISWGSLGTIWNKPFVQVLVRPQRHTLRFLETFDTFTLCAFRPACRAALTLLGSKSGRDGDKIAEAGLTPVASRSVAAPAFAEADLVIECRKIYTQKMDPKGFCAPWIDAGNYAQKDYHHIFFGEIVAVRGTEEYA
jgi:flavin reductase (DIM6/NTAB) family NADH-FMN oxidoreductase RutF